MHVVSLPARQARTHYRHEVRTLTYVTLDAANGGIVRNLNRDGVAVQAVAPLRHEQRVRIRFELRFPRLRVDTYGQVSWAGSSGQCGVRFLNLPAQTARQIDQWIFSNLLNALALDAANHSIFATLSPSPAVEGNVAEENDGLIVSAAPRPAIRIELDCAQRSEEPAQGREQNLADAACPSDTTLNWLSRPISGQTLAWLVDSLVMIAGLLLFAFIFLSITHELPPWPLTVGAASSAAVLIAATYWAVFAVLGGGSLGARLADATSGFTHEEDEEAARFR